MNSSAGSNQARRAKARVPGRANPLRSLCGVAIAAMLVVGCKTDLNQQLLERELRMQEDQIYHLQDELQSKAARLERAVGENSSLKRQLGITDAGPATGRMGAPGGAGGRSSAAAPTFVPPPPLPKGSAPTSAGAAPGGLRFGPGGAAPPALVPPKLDGVPPALVPPKLDGVPPALIPPKLDGVPPLPSTGGLTPTVRRLSHEESLGSEGRITHLVINPTRTECFDSDGDGRADGLAVVIEPRDADERLVNAAGDMVVFVNDPAVPQGAGFAPAIPTDPGEGGCIARWDIPEAEATAHFRRTSRARGLHLLLRWPGPPPQSGTVNVHAVLTTFDGSVHHVDAPVPVRSAAPPRAP